MKRKGRSGTPRRLTMGSRAGLYLVVFLIYLTSCTPTAQPNAVAVLADYDVRRNDTSASATWSQLGQIDTLGDGDWHGLLQDVDHAGFVTTDENGQAELCDPADIIADTQMCRLDACHIWIFQASDTGFGAYVCPKSTLGTDLCSGGSLDLDGCQVCLTTLSAEICTVGTSFSVTYLWASQVTILTVDEGKVEVRAVVAVDSNVPPLKAVGLEKSIWQDLKVERTLETSTTLVAAAGDDSRVYYTAPDAVLELIRAASPDAPPARQALPIESLPFFYKELPIVLEQIGLPEPNLQLWMHEISQQAILRQASFPFFPVPSEGLGELEVQAERDLLANQLVHDALLKAAAAGNLAYTPSLDREALTPGVVIDRPVVILYPADNRQLAAVAAALQGQLVDLGFVVEVRRVLEGEMLSMEPSVSVISLGAR